MGRVPPLDLAARMRGCGSSAGSLCTAGSFPHIPLA
jgi:hypothetical protein